MAMSRSSVLGPSVVKSSNPVVDVLVRRLADVWDGWMEEGGESGGRGRKRQECNGKARQAGRRTAPGCWGQGGITPRAQPRTRRNSP